MESVWRVTKRTDLPQITILADISEMQIQLSYRKL